jgi:nitroimidazol reductase NimA-like FMN-containing flavoprotein (pyridoxamine 5'-phosphate oxidase superfamily)
MTDTLPKRYHPRRMVKELTNGDDLLAIIRKGEFLTLALCQNNQPYLVSLDYAFDETANCFYAHCAKQGKKMDIIRSNPNVWGQVMEDHGYAKGQCTHAYRCVMFEGIAEFVTGEDEQRAIMEMLMEKFEPGDLALQQKMLTQAEIKGVANLRIRISAISGKQSPPPK